MKTVFLLLMLTGLVRCSDQPAPTAESAADSVIIRSGTSFGFCMGYCKKDMELVGTQATFAKSSEQDPTKYPTRTCTRTLTTNKAAEFNLITRFSEFAKQPNVIGCPDCADGGLEYVDIQVGERRHKVAFEYGKTIPGFESLVKELRTQRDLFSTCE